MRIASLSTFFSLLTRTPSSTSLTSFALFIVLALLMTGLVGEPAMGLNVASQRNPRRRHQRQQQHHYHNRQRGPTRLLDIDVDLAGPTTRAVKPSNKRGKYSMREEVVKKVEITHPCQLTRTAVKVTFPSMKHEVLVSFIGYKEPRLMFVNRCKGVCSGGSSIGQVACVPTKRTWKKVNMQLKTQVLGREMREKFRELVLEEHEECACQCLGISPSHCMRPDLFNNETCSCACDRSIYRRDKTQCEAFGNRRWDELTCSCRPEHGDGGGGDNNNDHMVIQQQPQNNPKLVNSQDSGGGGGEVADDFDDYDDYHHHTHFTDVGLGPPRRCSDCLNCLSHVNNDLVSKHSWSFLGCSFVLIVALVASTAFFWRKQRLLAEELRSNSTDEEDKELESPADGHSSPRKANHHHHHRHYHGNKNNVSYDYAKVNNAAACHQLDSTHLMVNMANSNGKPRGSHQKHQDSLGRRSTSRTATLESQKSQKSFTNVDLEKQPPSSSSRPHRSTGGGKKPRSSNSEKRRKKEQKRFELQQEEAVAFLQQQQQAQAQMYTLSMDNDVMKHSLAAQDALDPNNLVNQNDLDPNFMNYTAELDPNFVTHKPQ